MEDNPHMRCKFCNESFDDEARAPRILFTCGHSICTACLSDFLSSKDFFHCPEDQTRISLVDASLDSFPANKALMDVLRTTASPTEARGSINSRGTDRRAPVIRKGLSEKKLSQFEVLSAGSGRRTVAVRHRGEGPETLTLGRSFSRNAKTTTNRSEDSLSEEVAE